MTEQQNEKSDVAGDCRRAAGLIVHYSRADLDGLNALLMEAAKADRVTPMILALLDLYAVLIPELRTAEGIRLMSSHVLFVAGFED